MMSAGVLMIQDVSSELMAEGISLSEVKSFAENTENELSIQAGTLAIGTGASLTSDLSSTQKNPFSSASVVLEETGKIYNDKLATFRSSDENQRA